MDVLTSLAVRHLRLRLKPVNRALADAVVRQKAASDQLARPDLSPLCLTDEHVKILLAQIDFSQHASLETAPVAWFTPEEQSAEQDLIKEAASHGLRLPFQQLSHDLGLTDVEEQAILLCAAPELDRTYERIYGFILDDLNRCFPCLELLVSLTSSTVEERVTHRQLLGGFGRLRRCGIVVPAGPSAAEFRQELRLGAGVFECLAGAAKLSHLYRDRNEVPVPGTVQIPPALDPDKFSHLVMALARGELSVLAIWGASRNGVREVSLALAASAGRTLRQLCLADLDQQDRNAPSFLEEQIKIAAALDALLWIDLEPMPEPAGRLLRLLASSLAECPVPIVLTGENPWRPEQFLRRTGYAELELPALKVHQREEMWAYSLPELEMEKIQGLAARFSLSGRDINTIAQLARTRARLAGNGQPDSVGNHVAAACSVITQRSTTHFSSVVMPKRGPESLVLRPDLHSQVLEVATFVRLRHRVDEDWGFGRLTSGTGMKVLFAGEPGTGKTLAAEVIAGLIGAPLYKVDLARIVSKWVGETEKNIEAVFREVEECDGVLFFDEAEALFGNRGTVQSGTDRYANLEVSYLLQRLESASGLVILATNVKDQIDQAFMRRFQVIVHFPKPGVAERRRIWQMAFPREAPVAPDLDLDALARLDMTGAAIVNAARSAALLAADSGSLSITMADVIRATARQFRREARVLTPAELGSYGALLQGTL